MTTTEKRHVLPWQAPHTGLTPNDAPALHDWAGYLTRTNGEAVARRIEEQFAGGRYLVVTSAHEYRRWEPEVHTCVRIEERPETIGCDVDAEHAYISFSCGSYVYGLYSYMADQPPFRIDLPERGRPRDVLAWIREAPERDVTPWLHFTDRSLLVRDRAPDGKGYWLRFDLLEHAGTRYVVLEPEEQATAVEAMEHASSLPHLDERIDARSELVERIHRLWDDPDGEKLERWLPRG